MNINMVSGEFEFSIGPHLKWRVVYGTTAVDTVFNTSDMNFKIYAERTNMQYDVDSSHHTVFIYTGLPDAIYVDTIDTSLGFDGAISKLIVDTTMSGVQHKDDGTQVMRLCVGMYNYEIYHNPNLDEPIDFIDREAYCRNIRLTAIPQTSAIESITRDIYVGAADGDAEQLNTMTIDIAPLEEDYRHDIIIALGEYSDTVYDVYDIATFKPPASWLAAMPAEFDKNGTITLITYNDIGMEVGRAKTFWRAHVPAEAVPEIDGLTVTQIQGSFPLSYGWIQGKSTAKVEIVNPHTDWGSPISAYMIKGGGYSSDELTMETGTLNSPGENVFEAYVIDSRGRSSATKTAAINITEYSPPRFLSVLSERCENDGTLLNEGSYMKTTISYEFDSLSGSNSVTEHIWFKKSTESEYTQLQTAFGNGTSHVSTQTFDISSAYDIRYQLTDAFGSSYYDDILSVSVITMEFRAGGKGIAFGKAAEAVYDEEGNEVPVVDIGWRAYFREGIQGTTLWKASDLSDVTTYFGAGYAFSEEEYTQDTITIPALKKYSTFLIGLVPSDYNGAAGSINAADKYDTAQQVWVQCQRVPGLIYGKVETQRNKIKLRVRPANIWEWMPQREYTSVTLHVSSDNMQVSYGHFRGDAYNYCCFGSTDGYYYGSGADSILAWGMREFVREALIFEIRGLY